MKRLTVPIPAPRPMRLAAFLVAALLGAGGPALADDAAWTRFLVAPGKYVLFNCQQLDVQAKTNEKRMHELEALMAKSGSEFANAVAYKPEYLQLSGEMEDIRREAADKKCKTVPGTRAPHRAGATLR